MRTRPSKSNQTLSKFLTTVGCLTALSLNSQALAGPYDADFDARINLLCLNPPAWPQSFTRSPKSVWRAPVPHKIQQIWFGPMNEHWDYQFRVWRGYAEFYNYEHRLYTDADIPFILETATQELKDKFFQLFQMREYRGASDIARYLLLVRQGGIHLDLDMKLPMFKGQPMDLKAMIPLRGLTVVTDGEPVDWGVGGIHALNGILAAPPQHPSLVALVSQLASNIDCCLQAGMNNPVIMTGPAVLNQFLVGPVTVIPTIFWDTLGLPDFTWR